MKVEYQVIYGRLIYKVFIWVTSFSLWILCYVFGAITHWSIPTFSSAIMVICTISDRTLYAECYGVRGTWKAGLECGFLKNRSNYVGLREWWWQGVYSSSFSWCPNHPPLTVIIFSISLMVNIAVKSQRYQLSNIIICWCHMPVFGP